MAKVKGAVNNDIKELLIEKGITRTGYLEKKLSKEAWEIFILATPVRWISLEIAEEIVEVGAQELYPEDNERLIKLGSSCAQRAMNGIHRMFIRIPSSYFVLKRVAQIWRTYYDQGAAQIVDFNEDKKEFYMVVTGIPELPPAMRKFVGGFVVGMMALVGYDKTQIRCLENNPEKWKWHLTWE